MMTSEMLNTKEIDDILQVIRKVYHTIIYVDLGDGSYHCIQTSKALLEKRDFDIQSLTEYLTSSGLVYAEDAKEFAEFFDLDKMRQLLDDGKEYLSITYRRAKGGRYRWDMLEVSTIISTEALLSVSGILTRNTKGSWTRKPSFPLRKNSWWGIKQS